MDMSYSDSLDDGVWIEELSCFLCRMEIDMIAKVVRFSLAWMNAADRRGAIAIAKKHLPDVKIIVIVAPRKALYELRFEHGEWLKYA
jgi:hypothetical protein